MESTGRYHLPWARRLSQAGFPVYVLNALLAKRLMSAANALRQNKTDKIDARELACVDRIHGNDLSRFRYHEHAGLTGLRTLCQVRVHQRRLLTDTLKSANHLLKTMLPEAPWLALAANRGLATLFIKIDSLARLRAMRMATLQTYVCGKTEVLYSALRDHQQAIAAQIREAVIICVSHTPWSIWLPATPTENLTVSCL